MIHPLNLLLVPSIAEAMRIQRRKKSRRSTAPVEKRRRPKAAKAAQMLHAYRREIFVGGRVALAGKRREKLEAAKARWGSSWAHRSNTTIQIRLRIRRAS